MEATVQRRVRYAGSIKTRRGSVGIKVRGVAFTLPKAATVPLGTQALPWQRISKRLGLMNLLSVASAIVVKESYIQCKGDRERELRRSPRTSYCPLVLPVLAVVEKTRRIGVSEVLIAAIFRSESS